MCYIRPFFVSRFTRRLDGRRLRLPAPWCISGVQHWLLFPRSLLGESSIAAQSLCLAPADAELALGISDRLKHHSDLPPTLATATAMLRGVATLRGLDPTLVTHHRINAKAPHLILSPAQLNWLCPKSRSLVLTGELTTIKIWSEETYARWDRSASRPRRNQGCSSRR